MRGSRGGFKVIEGAIIFIIVIWVVVVVTGLSILACGNFFYREASVLGELKADHPGVTKIVKTKRGVFGKSVITVEENGVRKEYRLDSDILFNYEFLEPEK